MIFDDRLLCFNISGMKIKYRELIKVLAFLLGNQSIYFDELLTIISLLKMAKLYVHLTVVKFIVNCNGM